MAGMGGGTMIGNSQVIGVAFSRPVLVSASERGQIDGGTLWVGRGASGAIDVGL